MANDIGNITSDWIIKCFEVPENKLLLDRLNASGTHWKKHDRLASNRRDLIGQRFCITGTLTDITRHELIEILIARGASVSNSVSPKLTALIVGESTGSKLKKAEALKIPMFNEESILDYLKQT